MEFVIFCRLIASRLSARFFASDTRLSRGAKNSIGGSTPSDFLSWAFFGRVHLMSYHANTQTSWGDGAQ
jgi:hypothetical protein